MQRILQRSALIVSLLVTLFCVEARAAQWGVAGRLGLLQQPSSQYYLFYHGVELGWALDSGYFGVLVQADFRPQFKSQGFSEKDDGYFALLTSRLTDVKKWWGIVGGIGFGQMQGSLSGNGFAQRSYVAKGITYQAELDARFSGFRVALGHKSLTAIMNKREFESRVAWPFLFYYLSLGWVYE